jgi:hypothetical protein
MIHQIAPIPTKTSELPRVNPALIKVRRIQARVRGLLQPVDRPQAGVISSATGGAPSLVTILRWIE